MNNIWIALIGMLFLSCSTIKNEKKDDGRIAVNFLLINDVYEIAPLSGGKEGGLARVAALKKKYLHQNPNSFLVVAGDFLSPSLFNSIRYEGSLVRGKQMVEAMNAAGVDLAVFGNHEFDIRENELLQRLQESSFQWVSGNVFHKTDQGIEPFQKNNQAVPETYTFHITDADGTFARIGVIGLCLPFNKAGYVHYSDALTTAKNLYNRIKDSVDAVIALTHQNMEEDIMLAREIPQLAMILGGHEHDQRQATIGKVPIVKAMSNARTSFIVELHINKKRKRSKTSIRLEKLNEQLEQDSLTATVVQRWNSIIEKSFNALGFHLNNVILEKGEPLEGREELIRKQQTNLGYLITASLLKASPRSQIALINSGAIKLDDVLMMPMTEYDVVRSLPYGGGIREIEMKGELVLKVLHQGRKNAGTGGYLLHNKELTYDNGNWKLKGELIDPFKSYQIVLSDFLFEGREVNLEFLNKTNPDILAIHPEAPANSRMADIRLIIIDQLKKNVISF